MADGYRNPQEILEALRRVAQQGSGAANFQSKRYTPPSQGVRDRQLGVNDARIAALRSNPAMRPLIDEIAAGKSQPSNALGTIGSAVAGSLPVKMALGAIGVVDTGRRAVISGVREVVDAFDSDPATKASFTDFYNQTKDTSYGFGTAFPMEGFGGRLVGFMGDVLLDPLTYATLGGTIPKKALSEVVEAGVRKSTRELIGTKYLVGADARFSLARIAKQMGATDDAVKNIAARGRRAVPEDIAARMGLNRAGIYYFGSRVRVPFSAPIADALSSGLVKARLGFFNNKYGEKVGRAMTKTGVREGVNTSPNRFELATGRITDPKVASDLIVEQGAQNVLRAWSGIGEDNALKAFRSLLSDPDIAPYRQTIYRLLSRPESTWASIVGDVASPEVVGAQKVRGVFNQLIEDILAEGRKVDPNLKIGVIEDGYFPYMATDAALNAAQDTASPYALQIREYLKMDITDATGSFKPRGLKEGDDFFGQPLTREDVAGGIDRLNELSMERAGIKMFETDVFEVMKRYSRNYGTQIGTFKYLQELSSAGLIKTRGAAYQVGDETIKAAREAVEKSIKVVDGSTKSLRGATAQAVRSIDDSLAATSRTAAKAGKKAAAQLEKLPDAAEAKQILDGAIAAIDDKIAAAEKAWLQFLDNFEEVGAELEMMRQLHADTIREYQSVTAALSDLGDEVLVSWGAKQDAASILQRKRSNLKSQASKAESKANELSSRMERMVTVQRETADWFYGFYDDPQSFLRMFDDSDLLGSKFLTSTWIPPGAKTRINNLKHSAWGPGGRKATFDRWVSDKSSPEMKALRTRLDPKGRFKSSDLQKLSFVDDANPGQSVQHIVATGFSSAADLQQLRRVAIWQVARDVGANPALLTDPVYAQHIAEIEKFVVAAETIEDILRGTPSRTGVDAMLRSRDEISGVSRLIEIDNRLSNLAQDQEDLTARLGQLNESLVATQDAPKGLSGVALETEWRRILATELTGETPQEIRRIAKQMADAGRQPEAPGSLRSSLVGGGADPQVGAAARQLWDTVEEKGLRAEIAATQKKIDDIVASKQTLVSESNKIRSKRGTSEGVLLAQHHLAGKDGGVMGLVQRMGESLAIRHVQSLSDVRFRQMAVLADTIGMEPTEQMHDVIVAAVAQPLAEEAISAESRLGLAENVLRRVQSSVESKMQAPDASGNTSGYRGKNALVEELRTIFESPDLAEEAKLLREFFPEVEAVLSNYMRGASARAGRAFFADATGVQMAYEVARIMDELMPGARKWSLGEMERGRGVNLGGRILSGRGDDARMGSRRGKTARQQIEEAGGDGSINIIEAFSSSDAAIFDAAWTRLQQDIKMLETLVATKKIPSAGVMPEQYPPIPKSASEAERASEEVSRLVERARAMRDKMSASNVYGEFTEKLDDAYGEAMRIATELAKTYQRLADEGKQLGKQDWAGIRVATLKGKIADLEKQFTGIMSKVEADETQVEAAATVLSRFNIVVNEAERKAKVLAKATEPLASTKDKRMQARILSNISKNAAGFGMASHLRRTLLSSRDVAVKDFFANLFGGTVFDPRQGYTTSKILRGKGGAQVVSKRNVQEVYNSVRADPNNPGRFVDPAGNRVNSANERLDEAGRVMNKRGKPLTPEQEAAIPQNLRSEKLLMGQLSSRPTMEVLPQNAYLSVVRSGASRRKMLFGFLAEESGSAFSGSNPVSSILAAADSAALGAVDFSGSASSMLGPRAFARRLGLFAEELEETVSAAANMNKELLKTQKGLDEAVAKLEAKRREPSYRAAVARRDYLLEQSQARRIEHDSIVQSQQPIKIDGKEVIYSAALAREDFHKTLMGLSRMRYEDFASEIMAGRLPQLSRAEFYSIFSARLTAEESAELGAEYSAYNTLVADARRRLKEINSRGKPPSVKAREQRRLEVAGLEAEIAELQARRSEIAAEQLARSDRGRESPQFWSGLLKLERHFQSLDPSVNPNAAALQEAAGFKARGSGKTMTSSGMVRKILLDAVGDPQDVVSVRRKELVDAWVSSPESKLLERVRRLRQEQHDMYQEAERSIPESYVRTTERIARLREIVEEKSGKIKALKVNERVKEFNEIVEAFMRRAYGDSGPRVPRATRPKTLDATGAARSAASARAAVSAIEENIVREARKRPMLAVNDEASRRIFGDISARITEKQQRNRELLADAARLKEEIFAVDENWNELKTLFQELIPYSDELAAELNLPTITTLDLILARIGVPRAAPKVALKGAREPRKAVKAPLFERLDQTQRLYEKLSENLPTREAALIQARNKYSSEMENARNAYDAGAVARESLPKTIEQAVKAVDDIDGIRRAHQAAIAASKKDVPKAIRDESWMTEAEAFVSEGTVLLQSMKAYDSVTQKSVSQYLRARSALMKAEANKTIAERELLMLQAFDEMAKSSDPAAAQTLSALVGPSISGVNVVEHLDRGFVALGNQYPSLQARKEIAEIIQNVHRLNDPAIVRELSRFLSVYTKYFKAYATLSPGFHVRNSFGNAFMLFAAGSDVRNLSDGLRWSRLWYQASSDGKTMEQFLTTVPDNMRETVRETILATRASGGGMTEEALLDVTPFPAMLTGASRRAGRWLEQHSRFMLAYDGVARGMDMAMSAGRVRRFLIDYEDLSSVDRVMRQVVPFWMWASRNFPLQIQTMWTNPKPYQIYNSIKRNLRDEEGEENVPEWMQEMGAFKLPFGENLYATPDFGFNRLGQNVSEFQDPARLLSQVNPLIRLPIELAGGRQLFNNRRFSETPIEVTDGMSPVLQPLLEALGYGQTGEGGKKFVDDKAYYALRNLIPLLATSERLSPSIPTGQERGTLNPLLGFLGSPVRKLTPQMEESELARRQRLLQQLSRVGGIVNAPQE